MNVGIADEICISKFIVETSAALVVVNISTFLYSDALLIVTEHVILRFSRVGRCNPRYIGFPRSFRICTGECGK